MNPTIYEIKEQDMLTYMKTHVFLNMLHYLKRDDIPSRTYDPCLGKQMFKCVDTLSYLRRSFKFYNDKCDTPSHQLHTNSSPSRTEYTVNVVNIHC